MNIPLHAPIPLRLVAKSGKWLLEVERFVAVRAQLFRPRRETVEGEGAILRALSASEDADLTDTARTLMRGGLLPERCYEVVEGGFSEAALPDSIPDAQPAMERTRAEEQEMTRVRDQLLTLQMKVERLRTQVTDLEHGAPPKQLTRGDPEPAAKEIATAPTAPSADQDLVAEHSSDLAGRDLLADDSSDLAGRDLLADDSPAEAPISPALDLGTPKEHVEALDALFLGAATFTESSEATTPGLLMIDESYFVSKLANQSGECVGALLVDGPTLKMLGAAIGLKDLASAMVTVLARNPANPTIFACDAEQLDPVELPWLFDAQKRLDLDDSLGGHVLLLGR